MQNKVGELYLRLKNNVIQLLHQIAFCLNSDKRGYTALLKIWLFAAGDLRLNERLKWSHDSKSLKIIKLNHIHK